MGGSFSRKKDLSERGNASRSSRSNGTRSLPFEMQMEMMMNPANRQMIDIPDALLPKRAQQLRTPTRALPALPGRKMSKGSRSQNGFGGFQNPVAVGAFGTTRTPTRPLTPDLDYIQYGNFGNVASTDLAYYLANSKASRR